MDRYIFGENKLHETSTQMPSFEFGALSAFMLRTDLSQQKNFAKTTSFLLMQ